MSLHPEYVARLEALLSEYRNLGRKLAQLLLDASRGTADVAEKCLACANLGTVHVDGGAAPCSCAAGQTFRNALAVQERKRQAGTAPAARFLPNDGNPSARDRAAGRDE